MYSTLLSPAHFPDAKLVTVNCHPEHDEAYRNTCYEEMIECHADTTRNGKMR